MPLEFVSAPPVALVENQGVAVNPAPAAKAKRKFEPATKEGKAGAAKPVAKAAKKAAKEKVVKPEVDMTAKDRVVATRPAEKLATYFPDEVTELDPHDLDFTTDKNSDLYDERAFWPADPLLAGNIGENGQLEPIYVYPTGDDRYLVLAGTRRLNAIRKLNESLKPAQRLKVRAFVADPEVGDLGAAMVQVLTNEQRKDDPLQVKATKMRRMARMQGYDNPSAKQADKAEAVRVVATNFGVTPQTVRNAFALLERATAEVKAAVNEGIISETVAVRLSNKPKDEQIKAIKSARKASQDAAANQAKGAGGKKAKTKVTEAQLLSKKPSAQFAREVIGHPGTPKDISNALQYFAVNDLDTEAAKSLMPWFKKNYKDYEHAPE